MDKQIQAQQIYDTFHLSLGLNWLTGSDGAQRTIAPLDPNYTHVNLVSYLNLIHPPLLQILDEAEIEFLHTLGTNSLQDTLASLFGRCAMVIITTQARLPSSFLSAAESHGVPVLSANSPSKVVINRLHYYLSRQLARQETRHGVFLEVLGMGVLISGASGIGKSELALELISRGHRLIADDAPYFTRTAPDVLNGACPEVLSGFLEVRGLGILNIPAMFGENAIKTNKNLKLIIQLQPSAEFEHSSNDRIYGSVKEISILGVMVPQLTLPVASGRNLAVLVEGAVRNHILRIRGYNAADAFVAQQRLLLDTANK